jgi:hypothetical protein
MNDPIPERAATGLLEIPAEDGSGPQALTRREIKKRYRALYPEKWRAQRRRYRHNRQVRERRRVFAHYGTSCACCGTGDRLTIDHVNGDGAEHRREMGNRGGSHTYHWLVMNGFPPGFQTLCDPCNLSKDRGPACRLDHTEEQDRRGAEDAGRSLIAL